MSEIRVLRILEYVYPNAQAAAEDMSRWTLATPLGNKRVTTRSATLPFEVLQFNEPKPIEEIYPHE